MAAPPKSWPSLDGSLLAVRQSQVNKGWGAISRAPRPFVVLPAASPETGAWCQQGGGGHETARDCALWWYYRHSLVNACGLAALRSNLAAAAHVNGLIMGDQED